VRNPFSAQVLFADRKFATPSGKVNLITEEPAGVTADPRYPLGLMALSSPESQSSQWVAIPEGVAEARVHPDAAAGIADLSLARLESAVGAMTVRVRHDSSLRRDVVHMQKGGHLSRGQCANALTRARLTDLGEGGALYDEGVRLVPLEPSSAAS
jgi:hypothetical protein